MRFCQKGAAHDLKRAFCTIFMESALFLLLWREFQARVTIFKTLSLQNAIWPKRAAHDLKSAFWKVLFWKVLFSRFEENLRPVSRFYELWRFKMRFGQNLLRMTWKERFVQFSWKANCVSVLKRIWGQFHDFEKFDASKCDFAETCCAWPEKSVLYNFHGKRTVFPFWREFETSFTNLRTFTLKNAIWPKRALQDLKSSVLYNFHEKPTVFPLKRIWYQLDDFENFYSQKCDLPKTCSAGPEKSFLYNFHGNRNTVRFPWKLYKTLFSGHAQQVLAKSHFEASKFIKSWNWP